MGADLPSETVTFLFTDVVHSTELVKRLRDEYGPVLAAHRDLLRAAFTTHSGMEVDTQGDAFFVAFGHARDAVSAAAESQRGLAAKRWPRDVEVCVRMGLHTGEAYRADHGYAGLAVHRAARICTLAHGGQVLLSRSTAGILDDEKIPGIAVRDLGDCRLKDFEQPERIFQLVIEGLPSQFPPLRTLEQQFPLSGTVTVVMVEGRQVMRLAHELPPGVFGALIHEYRRLLSEVFEVRGGRYIEAAGDTVLAAFSTATEAASAAARVISVVEGHEWPHQRPLAVSIGVHSGVAGVGWAGVAAMRCEQLCDAAGSGEIFVSPATAGLLEDEYLGELRLRDLGERKTRRTREPVKAHELLLPLVAESSEERRA